MTHELKKLADYCFINGFSSTRFMREISRHPDCKIELNEPSSDCYYPSDEPELLKLIMELGYTHSPFGFCRN